MSESFTFRFNGYYDRNVNNRYPKTTAEQLTTTTKYTPMRAKHTSGPWRAKVAKRDAASGEPLAYDINSQNWEALATVYGSDDPTDTPEYRGHGNAALIAAAPALLQACQLASTFLKEAESDTGNVRIAMELLDAAIRQATTEVD